MAKSKTKYLRTLLTIPDDTWLEFKSLVPEGQRSETITRLVKIYVLEKRPKTPQNDFQEFLKDLKKHRKGDYSHEDPVKLAKEAWNYVD